ncbi:MAG: transposase [Planctomycetota bacterium]|nr:transposase [Planctomycetota bacterium]
MPPTASDAQAALKRLSCYLARPTVAFRRVEKTADGRYRILASSTGRPPAELDPEETIHQLLLHVPERGQHPVRCYGAYSNRLRRAYREPVPDAECESEAAVVTKAERGVDRADPVAVAQLARWARLLARVFEVNPLLCPQCGHEMRVVGFVTQPAVVDQILAHRETKQLTSPFEPRAPPAA